ncbi:MAG: hypothetical protein II992_08710, partial [Lachnospiraceae bacterium]|nr:hypothetical protein [Lachnospiraceae bacterium]
MTTEDRKNEAQEKSALAEAMGAAKRKSKDMAKKMMKKVALAFAKAAIPMFLALLKVLAVVIVVAIITSLIGSVLDWFSGGESNTNTDETYNSVVSTEASGMDITSETIRLSEDEIKSYIENYDSTNITLKNEMLGKIEEIYKWQEDYGYSAMFLITIAFEDNINAEAIDDFITEMSTKAATWNINGYKATKEIAKEYVADDTYADWANNIENKIQENAVKSGIIILGQEVALSGDGYDNAYISKKGTMYRNYKQTKGSYSQVKWCGEDTIYESACPLIC